MAKIVKLEELAPPIQALLREAASARDRAYCPYSRFAVGAALLCRDGAVFAGCNVENAAFTVGVCAERSAYCRAIAEGRRDFEAVAVVARLSTGAFTTPCGACRQFMVEFGDAAVYMARPGLEEVMVSSLVELMPHYFRTDENKGF